MLGLPADGRDYAIAANILADLGVEQVNLLTNNPEKVAQLTQYGINVAPAPRSSLALVPRTGTTSPPKASAWAITSRTMTCDDGNASWRRE